MILILQGPAALSAFRHDRLLADLRRVEPSVTGLDARFVHLVETACALESGERERLARILDYGHAPETAPGAGLECLVVPRLGTLSP